MGTFLAIRTALWNCIAFWFPMKLKERSCCCYFRWNQKFWHVSLMKSCFLHHSKYFLFVYVFMFVQLVCVTKYKNCLCGFVYPNGDKKLRSIIVLYFFLLYNSQLFVACFYNWYPWEYNIIQIDSYVFKRNEEWK